MARARLNSNHSHLNSLTLLLLAGRLAGNLFCSTESASTGSSSAPATPSSRGCVSQPLAGLTVVTVYPVAKDISQPTLLLPPVSRTYDGLVNVRINNAKYSVRKPTYLWYKGGVCWVSQGLSPFMKWKRWSPLARQV